MLKKIIIPVSTIFIFVIGLAIYFLVFQKQKSAEEPQIVPPEEKTLEEILQDLTAPEGEKIEAPEEVIKSLTAPKQGKTPEGTLQSLTAPE